MQRKISLKVMDVAVSEHWEPQSLYLGKKKPTKPTTTKKPWNSLLSQKWGHLPLVQYANTLTEQRYCIHGIFAQIRLLGDSSTKLAHCLAESQGLDTLTKPNKLLVTFRLAHHITHTSKKYTPSLLNNACSHAGGVRCFWFWIESVVM